MPKWESENIPEPLSQYNKRRRGKRRRLLTEQELEEGVVGVCSGRLVADESAKTKKVREAHFALQVYIDKHALYWSSRKKSWRRVAERSPGALGCCSRAVAQAQLLEVDIHDYMEAQFWFFNEAFARPPTYAEIAASGCLLRYKKWRMAKVAGEAPSATVNAATGGIFNPKDTLPEVVLAYEEKVLERMIRQWGSEEEVWRMFGALGDEEVFSDSFKVTRDIWNKIYR